MDQPPHTSSRDPSPARAAQQLERLRAYRTRHREAPLALTIEQALPKLRRQARAHDKIAALLELWGAAAPDELRALAAPTGYSRGRLDLACADEGARYRVDRWLRTEGLALLRSLSPVTLQVVRARVAPGDSHTRAGADDHRGAQERQDV